MSVTNISREENKHLISMLAVNCLAATSGLLSLAALPFAQKFTILFSQYSD